MHIKHRFIPFFIGIICIFFSPVHCNKKVIIAATSIGISTACIYGLYRWLRTEEQFTPTLDNLNTFTFTHNTPHDTTIATMNIDELVTRINKDSPPEKTYISFHSPADHNKNILVTKGINIPPSENTVFIFSRGYARTNTPGTNDNALQKGGCAMAAYIPIKDNVINTAPCITFDYPDRRRCFNFGQKKDVSCLRFVYNEILKKNPNINIILIGDCRGAKTILNFAAEKPKNIKALALFSPFFSAQELTVEVARNYLSWLPGASSILQNFFKLWFPSYDTQGDNNFSTNATNIIKNMPIFIAHRNQDTLVSTSQVTAFTNTLKQSGHHHVHLVTTDDTTARHSRLTPVNEIKTAINQFFYSYKLPHNPLFITA